MKPLAGLDLNGLWDWAALHNEESGELLLKDGGVNGSAVRLVDKECEFIVGPQTALAPHGRGEGWGELGAARYRIGIADCLDAVAEDAQTEEHSAALIALTNELVGEAPSLVAAVPDEQSFSEGARDRLLQTLRRTRSSAISLLWRPVAATLGWAADGSSPPDGAVDGARVAILSIMCDAVYFGHLRLEVKSSKQGDLIVPVRSSGGRIALPGFGGRTVSQGAAAALARSEDIPEAELLAGMHGPWNLAVGQVPETELYRRSNQTWCLLPAPTSPSDITSDCVPDDQVLRGLADADVILIEGAAAGSPAVESGALRALKLRREDPAYSTAGTSSSSSRLSRSERALTPRRSRLL